MSNFEVSIYLLTPLIAFVVNYIVIHANRLGPFICKLLHVSSYKSQTSALLLGGLSIFVALTIALIIGKKEVFQAINILAWIVPAFVLVVLGYADDKLELRARQKLIGQLISLFAFISIRFLYKDFDTAHFIAELSLIVPFGIICINGSNLLDGLDTISIKYSFVVNTLFLSLGNFYNISELISFSTLSFLPLGAFYFYNKSPAKLYLGEIGGTVIGFNTLFMSTMLYDGYIDSIYYTNQIDALSLAFIGMYLPALELGISFLRRLVAGKAPFFGDKLHIHYLLVDNFRLSASKAASYIAFSHLSTITLALSLLVSGVSPVNIFLILSVSCLTLHYSFGYQFWHGSSTQNEFDHNNVISLMGKSQINYLDKTSLIADAVEAEKLIVAKVYAEELLYNDAA